MTGIDRRDLIKGGLTVGALVSAQSARASSYSVKSRLLEALAGDLRRHAGFGIKRSGGAGDRATANWISKRLKASGFAVETDPFDVPFFDAGKTELRFRGGEAVDLFVQPAAATTPADGLTAPVVPVYNVYDAGAAEGKIALVVLPYGRHAAVFQQEFAPLIATAIKARPQAIVLVTTGPTGLVTGLNMRDHAIAPMPLALMAPKDLPRVLKAGQGGERARLTITGTAGRRATWNIVATRRRGPHWLVVSTPRTGWFTCAGERGTGTAVFLNLCSWAARRYPDHSLLALNTGGHEIDFSGLHKAIPFAPPPEKTVMWAHIGASLAVREAHVLVDQEMGLLDIADPNRALMASENLISASTKYFAGLPGLAQPINAIPGVGELGDIVAKGFRSAFSVVGVHRWFHTRDDTLDKVDAKILLPVLHAHRRLIAHALS